MRLLTSIFPSKDDIKNNVEKRLEKLSNNEERILLLLRYNIFTKEEINNILVKYGLTRDILENKGVLSKKREIDNVINFLRLLLSSCAIVSMFPWGFLFIPPIFYSTKIIKDSKYERDILPVIKQLL